MRRAILFLPLVLVFLAGRALAGDTIKIGAVLSVTGPASFLGEPEKNTISMLQEAINARGGLLGKKLEVVFYDDETDVNKAVLAAEKLLKRDEVVAAMGGTTSGNTLAIMGKFAAAGIPLVSLASAEKITSPADPFVFKVAPSDRHAVQKILDHARAKGYKKLAIVTVSDGFGQAGREALKELIAAGGFELAADEVYGPKDTDMTAQLTKIKELPHDAVICWGTNPGPAVIARNRVQIGLTTPMYMSHGVASKKFIELAGEAAEGLLLPAGQLIVAGQLPDGQPQKKLLLDYTRQYQEKFGGQVSTFGGHGYDSLSLIARAIETAGSDKPQAIRDALEKITAYPGVGGVFTMSPADHNGLSARDFVMVAIEKGDWKIVAE
ncbi:MAG: ABC transporter substrate-binding protein [Desulfovibrionaceae bacterium]|nr:ABC transporter substrate-binding protein [Desulfovibrionaceae bacterium]MBF0513435.1 ABC transporter substrate-binding protein [Desulfovibrionaceae bacterium]